MDFFAVNDAVVQLEADLKSAGDGERLEILLALSWQLRQRDTQRALALADEVESLLAAMPQSVQPQYIASRLLLIRGEAQYLQGNLAIGQTLGRNALQGFILIKDACGCADAHALLGWIEVEQGDIPQAHTELEAIIAFTVGNDVVRLTAAQTGLARLLAFKDAEAAKQRWCSHFEAGSAGRHPAAVCWVEDFLATVASQCGDYVSAIRHRNNAYTLALASGQKRRAIFAAINIGDSFNSLNEYHTALEWLERGLELARPSGWPSMIGYALMQTAETLRRLQRLDAARNMLLDALAMMAPIMASRHYANALFFLGNVELDRKEYTAALETFQLLEQRAVALNQTEPLFGAQRGQAEAFLRLGQPQSALRAAKTALLSAKNHPEHQIRALRILAEIHTRHPALQFSQHSSIRASAPPLHYLQKALDLAATIKGYIIPGDLLDATAEEHANKGNWQQAYLFAREASDARDKIHSLEADNRANAMQVNHQTERTQADDAHLRELASEARRAEILRQTSEILEHLGVIGQEITAHLETAQVFEVLNRHVHQLMNVDVFAIALMNNDGLEMNTVFGFDDAQLAPLPPFSLADADANLIQYALDRREIYIDRDPERGDPNWHLSTRPTCSRLYVPLCLGDKVLGVMSIQSRQRHAYGPREQLIFRSLCAYTAIALSNATAHGELNAAHRKLQETQQQLILQGKMAGLGTLTAGVAHEINNPTNFAHVAAQNQRMDIAEFEQFVATLLEEDVEPEIVQGFAAHFAKLSANVSIMLNGTERIKGIVKDLRAFTRLDEPEKKPVRLSECLISTLNLVRTSWTEKVEFITEFNDDPEIECWPALLNQVFMNLLMNGCQAIDEKLQQNAHQPHTPQRGKLWLRLNLYQGSIVIAFQDTGTGIDSAAQTRIIEPFYTTKAVGIGTGLGLPIAVDIVKKHGGDLDFTSTPGEGSCFTISLPLISCDSASKPKVIDSNLNFIDRPRGSNQ